jgi:hypothetical protein
MAEWSREAPLMPFEGLRKPPTAQPLAPLDAILLSKTARERMLL